MRPLLFGVLALLSACADVTQIGRRPGIQSGDAAALAVFRTVQVETPAHADAVTAIAVDRDQTLLLTGSADKTARLWNLADGAPRGVLRPPIGEGDLGRIDAVALSADGRLAAIGGRSAGPTQDAVLLFDTRTLRLVRRLERDRAARNPDTVTGIAFADGGQRVLVGFGADTTMTLFDVPSGIELGRTTGADAMPASDGPLHRLSLASGRRVTADGSGRIVVDEAGGRKVWDVAPAALAIDCIEAPADASQVRIAGPGGTRLFSAARMDWVRRADQTGSCRSPQAPPRLAGGGTIRSDGSRIARLTPDGGTAWADVTRHRVKAIAVSADGSAVVAALGDGTLRWLDAATGTERLALFLHAKGGWIAWTPGGFFDHSEEAWNFAGGHVNRGPRREAEFVKLAQLYDVAYRPDLIRLAYSGRAAAAEAVRLGDAVDPRTRLAGGLPPRVTLAVAPAGDRRTAIVETAVEERGGGIGKLLFRVNGVVVAIERASGQAPRGSAVTLTARRTVPLRNGPNQIEVVALDGADQLESAAVATVAQGSADPKQGQLWAVVVGINGYADPGMRLTFAKPDAQAIAAILPRTGSATFTKTNVVTLFDAEATTANIARTIGKMAETMAEADTFVLYLSGHGVNLQGRYSFVTYDVTAPSIAQVETLALSQEALQDLLAKVPAGSAIVLLDTCYSGRAVTLDESNMLIRNADRRLARATGRSVLAGATDQQAALEGYRGHGVLTSVLLDGLNGAAAPATEAITGRALGDYAVRHVPVISAKEFDAEQVPVFSFVGQDVVLVRRGKR